MQRDTVEGFRLSPQQKRVWLLQAENRAAPYRVQCSVRIEGPLSVETLQAGLQDVVDRHEVLRTTFHCWSGLTIPVQVIAKQVALPIHHYDLSTLSTRDQDARLETLRHEARRSPLEFERGPLLHASLIRLSLSNQLLLLSLSALCADATTIRNVVREIGRSYGSRLRGGSVGEETLQYADLAQWQIELLESADAEDGKRYWRRRNVSDELTSKLPYETRFSRDGAFAPERLGFCVAPQTLRKIEELVREEQTSVTAFLLAAWQILSWRLQGQPELVLGFACNGRAYEGLDSALGLLARVVPLRDRLEGNASFRSVLHRSAESMNEVCGWQEYFSWEHLGNSSADGASVPYLPLAFEFLDGPAQWSETDVSFRIDDEYACTDRFKLKLFCVRRSEALLLELHYDAGAFDRADIERLQGQLRTLLESAVDHPARSIAELDILTASERERLLVEFSGTTTSDVPAIGCVHQWIERRAERTPDAVAATFEDPVSYRELNRRANQLARHLRKLGVGPEALVGLCVERSLDMLVGILGILKAGGAYVPLDPLYPKERLALMLDDAQTAVLVTQSPLLEALPEHRAPVVCLDSQWETIERENDANPIGDVSAENLVYVIYTSGSTGKPKGVAVTHQNLAHSIGARTNFYREPVVRFLLLSSFAFDSSVAGIFWTLCQGGHLVLPRVGLEQDPSQIIESIRRERITHVLTLPSVYRRVLSEAEVGCLESLRSVIVAGEACPPDLVERHHGLLPRTSLFNEYGPTEATVWTTVHECRPQEPGTPVAIGRPIVNTEVYLLDSRLQPVPIGVPGELYIGGTGLARGYLNRAELTAEKFIPNPFGERPGSRLYKTGDLACYLADGTIEFLGRIDHQVKIRGFRVELGEIEAALRQHPAVRETVLLARDDAQNDKRLVAYVVPIQERPPTTSELRHFLQTRLPEYMVPSAFVLIDALPLTPNGKLDRRALPAPGRARPRLEATFVAPRDPVERVLSGIWSEVLDLEQVGIHDNFFELGGHSILAVQLISRLRDVFQMEVAVRTLFEARTVAGLAEAMIEGPDRGEKVRKTAQLLLQLTQLSEDEVQTMLDEEAS